MKIDFLNSLKSRYILFASILSVVVVLISFYGYLNVNYISKETTANIEARRQLLEHVGNIRIHIFEGYKSLDAFLLDPTREASRQQTHDAIQAAIKESAMLANYQWISKQKLLGTVEKLIEAFRSLDKDIDELMEVRIDPLRQYPSLELGNRVSAPNRNSLNSTIALVLDDPMLSDALKSRPVVYKSFVTLRHLWEQTLSIFRLYLANRVGSFNEASLPIQEKAIETMFGELKNQIKQLREYDGAGKLSFEMSAALDDIETSADGWFEGYLGAKKIHQSGAWRADTKFIIENIEPRLKEIDSLLANIDKHIESSGIRDMHTLTKVAKLQTNILIIMAISGLGVILITILSLQRLVFHPIDSVARALKAEAFGKEGVLLPNVRSKETQNLVDAFAEMRKQVRSRQSELEHQALHDALTSLPNRTLLQDRMKQAINAARREHKNITLLMIDLDRFKDINDTLGHHVGDNVLKEVGNRLIDTLRQIDTVARLGGDEYAVLLPDTDIAAAEIIAKKILVALENVFVIDELNLFIKASVGLAEYPSHGKDASTLVQHADVAMYVAKRGQLGYAIYNPKDDDYSIGRLALIADLRDALDRNLLKLHYQPVVDFDTGQTTGAEALLRWEHDKYGAIPPDQIIALAEQTGLIDDVTQWVLNEAIKQCSEWQQQNINISVSINISMYNLKNVELIPHIKSLLEKHKLSAKYITLEITESAMMANPKRSSDTLFKLHDMGIKLSIDDFGTGFSSLAYLKKLPIAEIKIDKSFVLDLLTDENDFMIVKSTVDLAHNLGIKVIAEGIETLEVYKTLHQMQCDTAQGFYISFPLEPKALIGLLMNNNSLIQQTANDSK